MTCTLGEISPVMYPNGYRMLQLCDTLPVTSCEFGLREGLLRDWGDCHGDGKRRIWVISIWVLNCVLFCIFEFICRLGEEHKNKN